MKKLFALVFGLLLFFGPYTVQAKDVELMPQEEIAEAPALDPMSEEALNYLLGEEMYLGETDWRGNKVATKFDYNKKKKKRQGNKNTTSTEHQFGRTSD